MPAPDLIAPGFYGKLPTAGDFVSRRLPPDFVRNWDRWVALHLMPLLASGVWPEGTAVCFMLGARFHGPAAGVVVPSADRARRRFPLTLAQPLILATPCLAETGAHWFSKLAATAQAARKGEFDADTLEAELADMPFPAFAVEGEPLEGTVFWNDPSALFAVAPEAPRAALQALLAPSWEPC
ncbi:type VI secretion system-associated protein TagF [Chelativorans salis]|uniref:Type VI secretion system-associated protein TagF n=1 Tax=Chelativorans salis TaxID=2978478 RepID=A0ABT2LIT1_9HYPH|nr:type VI secretion system-associated protein TagF [Chelativorans sp. EGI FJ00035]MCT7374146.1 type VI secretion system-associated protein TagF [Chelativorans sp. EGI FJ00035]